MSYKDLYLRIAELGICLKTEIFMDLQNYVSVFLESVVAGSDSGKELVHIISEFFVRRRQSRYTEYQVYGNLKLHADLIDKRVTYRIKSSNLIWKQVIAKVDSTDWRWEPPG